MEPGRVIPRDCHVEKDFIYNGRLHGVEISNQYHVKYPYYDCTRVNPTQSRYQYVDNTYRTFFGPVFSHSAITYRVSDINIGKALTRQTAARESILDEFQLRMNQIKSIQSRRFQRAMRGMRRKMFDLEHYNYDLEDMLFIYANQPHPKRKMRMNAALMIVDMAKVNHKTIIRCVNIKLKKYEFAKPGKYPRSIGDMTEFGAFIGGFVTWMSKKMQAETPDSSKHASTYVPGPTTEILRKMFDDFSNPQYASHLYYFSDDSCFYAKCKDGILKCNNDVSSCDSSHTKYLFEAFASLFNDGTRFGHYFTGLIDQLALNAWVRCADGKTKHLLINLDRILFSGSNLTTTITNFCQRLMRCELSRIDFSRLTREEAAIAVVRACRRAGYIITCEVADGLHDLQFLKHSPTRNNEPYLNLGVMFRALGQCKGDLPGRSKEGLKNRAYKFTSQLIRGFCHAGDSDFYRVLAEKWNLGEGSITPDVYQFHGLSTASRVTEEDICDRYRLTTYEYAELLQYCLLGDYGSVIRCTALDKIYHKDYGYAPPQHQDLT